MYSHSAQFCALVSLSIPYHSPFSILSINASLAVNFIFLNDGIIYSFPFFGFLPILSFVSFNSNLHNPYSLTVPSSFKQSVIVSKNKSTISVVLAFVSPHFFASLSTNSTLVIAICIIPSLYFY